MWSYWIPSGITPNLFKPQSQGGLGIYRPEVFEAWPLPRVTCDPGYETGQDVILTGCHWSQAIAPPEALGGQVVAQIGINASFGSQTGTLVAIPLRITNTGNVDADAIRITDVQIRTVPASQVTIESPSLPIDVGTLSIGSSTNITLGLRVPPGVEKIILTEDGFEEVGNLKPYKFSVGQVVSLGKQ
jgi:hypothetical protein